MAVGKSIFFPMEEGIAINWPVVLQISVKLVDCNRKLPISQGFLTQLDGKTGTPKTLFDYCAKYVTIS